MKLIKLDGRHTLGRRGFNYAFVFRDYAQGRPNEHRVGELVRHAEGYGVFYNNTFYGKSPGPGNRRPYYIGFKKESTATMVMLQLK